MRSRKEALFYHGVDISLNELPKNTPVRIVTLGPEGTSSEAAASALATTLAGRGHESVWVELSESYEDAATRVLGGSAELVVVANAYANVSEFYMEPRLRLTAAFVKDTPNYGLAAVKPVDALGVLTVASHPAPVPLIEELLPEGMKVAEVVPALSTSAAAAAAADGRVDAALTTVPAAGLLGLRFFSRTRSIRMLWSVFTHPEGRTLRPGADR
jgi:prephenate dehydratase